MSIRAFASLLVAASALTIGDATAASPCKFGSAWALPGSGYPGPIPHYLEVEGGDELQNPTGLSIDFWFYLDYDVLPTIFVAKRPYDGFSKFTYAVELTSFPSLVGYVGIEAPNGIFDSVVVGVDASVVAKKTWHRVVLTYDSDAGEARLHLDGTLLDSETETQFAHFPFKGWSVYPTPDPLHIGGSPIHPANTLLGAVDEVRIWTRALSPAEIEATAVAPLDGAEGLAASFHFDGTLLDLTGGHVATKVGAGSFQGKCASFGNYGQGIPGANGKVPFLELNAPPVNGTTRFLLVGNPTGQSTLVLLAIGANAAQIPAFGGPLLVEPTVTATFGIPPLGIGLPFEVPSGNHVFHMQSFIPDEGAVHGVAASRGLFLHLGL